MIDATPGLFLVRESASEIRTIVISYTLDKE